MCCLFQVYIIFLLLGLNVPLAFIRHLRVWEIMCSGAKRSAFCLHPAVNPEKDEIEIFDLDNFSTNKVFRRTKFSSRLGVLLMFCLFFTKFQPIVAYKIVAYKKKRV